MSSQRTDSSKWGTLKDAADVYSVSEKTIRRMIERGEIEAIRFGPRVIRVNLESLEFARRPMQSTAIEVETQP
jgi:DNA binding domain, excisionase family